MKKATYFTTYTALSIGLALASPAAAGIIDLKLQSAGLTNAPEFTADALKATEVSHIVFDSQMPTFSEHGFAYITGVVDNGVLSTPTGLNSTYSLYFDFTITGNLITSQFTTLDFTLYGVDGVSQFGTDAMTNDAFVNNGSNVAIQLATNSLISGSIAGMPGSDLSAELFSVFNPTATGAAAFLSPNLPATFHGAFFHSASDPGGVVQAQDGSIVIHGGDDTLTFTPEPSSMFLLLSGVPAVWLLRRRR